VTTTNDETPPRAKAWLELVRPYTNRHRSSQFPFRAEHSALLVIDMQRYFLDRQSHAYLPMADGAVENVRRLVDAYRKSGLPVVFTRHAYAADEPPGIMARWWGDVLKEDDPMSEIESSLSPLPTEFVVRKTKYNAFADTELDQELRAREVKRVAVTGVMTHLCCESTAREAFMRDYEVYFVIDGTASKDEALHTSSLRTLTDGFAIPVTTKEVLGCLSR